MNKNVFHVKINIIIDVIFVTYLKNNIILKYVKVV
jgi:hypothetical protein